MTTDRTPDSTSAAAPPAAPQTGEPTTATIYTYAAAGIRERHGRVPGWLWAVVCGLTVWGIYYLVHYWNAPGV